MGWSQPNGTLYCMIELTDHDTLAKLAKLWDVNVRPCKVRRNGQPSWRIRATGYQAQIIMERLYPLFGERRQAKARTLLECWYADRPFLGSLLLTDIALQPEPEWTPVSIAWLAGLVEAEGWLGCTDGHALCLQVKMADRDVIDRAAALLNTNVTVADWEHLNQKTVSGEPCKIKYQTVAYGTPAAIAMRQMYPHLHSRRRAKIEESLTTWLTRPTQMKRWHGAVSATDILSGRVPIEDLQTIEEPIEERMLVSV